LCERKVKVFIDGKIERKKLKFYWKCKVTFILKQIFFYESDTHFKTEGVVKLLSQTTLILVDWSYKPT